MTLTIKYDDLNGVIRHSDSLADELSEYADALSRYALQPIYSVEGGMSGNLQTAEYSLTTKIKNLQSQKEDALFIRDKYMELGDVAYKTDQEVAGMIRRNKNDFLDKYPELRPPKKEEKNGVLDFICGVGDVIVGICDAIGSFLSDPIGVITDAIESIKDAVVELAHEIKEFWKNNWQSIVTAVAIVGVGILLIASGGTLLPILGLGLIAGTTMLATNDIVLNGVLQGKKLSEIKMSPPEDYIGESIGKATEFFLYSKLGPGGDSIASGVGNATSTLISSVLKKATGKSEESILEISGNTILAGAIGFVVGKFSNKITNSGFIKGIDKNLGKIIGRNSGLLFGTSNATSNVKAQLTNIAKHGTKIHIKTVKNLLISSVADSFYSAFKKKVKTGLTNLGTTAFKKGSELMFGTNIFDTPALRFTYNKTNADINKSLKTIYKALPAM